jgi:rod shape-determining protein MreD
MLRRTVSLGLLLVTVLLLQVSVLPLAVRGAFVPDLVVVLVALVALERGPRSGLWLAASGGLLVDLLADGVAVGSSMIAYGLVAYLLGLLRPYLTDGADVATAVLAGFGAAVSVAVHGALRGLLTTQLPPDGALVLSSALVVGAFGVLSAPLLTKLLHLLIGRPSRELIDEGIVA